MIKYCKIISTITIMIFLMVANTLAQAPDTMWTKTYAGDCWDEYCMDFCGSVQNTTDGGYIIGGTTWSYQPPSCAYLIKTDVNGDTLWTKTYGGQSGGVWGNFVQQTLDGGYIVAGWKGIGQDPWNIDLYLIKTDRDGDTLWTKAYGGPYFEYAESVEETSDSGYIIVGVTESSHAGGYDIYLVKTDINGDTMWTKTYGTVNREMGKFVKQTSDGGYIIVGETGTLSNGEYDIWLLKTDANGDTIWTNTYGGNSCDYGNFVQQTTDSGYIVVGTTTLSDTGILNVYLIKTDSHGDTLWTRTYGGTEPARGYSVQQTLNGEFIITGSIGSINEGESDVYIIKTDTNGYTLWTKTLGGANSDWGISVQQTPDDGYIIAGNTESFDPYMLIYLIKLAPDPTIIEEKADELIPKKFALYQNYPNPFNNSTIITFDLPKPHHVKLHVYNLLGQTVQILVDEQKNAGTYNIRFDASQIASGIYYYRLEACDFIKTKRMVVLK